MISTIFYIAAAVCATLSTLFCCFLPSFNKYDRSQVSIGGQMFENSKNFEGSFNLLQMSPGAIPFVILMLLILGGALAIVIYSIKNKRIILPFLNIGLYVTPNIIAIVCPLMFGYSSKEHHYVGWESSGYYFQANGLGACIYVFGVLSIVCMLLYFMTRKVQTGAQKVSKRKAVGLSVDSSSKEKIIEERKVERNYIDSDDFSF